MLTRALLSVFAGAVRRRIGCEAAHEAVVACACAACAPTWPAEGGASHSSVRSSFLCYFACLSKESWFIVPPALEVLPDLFRLVCFFRSFIHMRLSLRSNRCDWYCRGLRSAQKALGLQSRQADGSH